MGLLVVVPPGASASNAITVKVFPFTGEVQFHNEESTPAEFVFYSINSAAKPLHRENGVWLSIADTYDASGNGFIDPVSEWVEFAPNPMAPNLELAEGTAGSGGSLPPIRGISLGKVFDPGVDRTDFTVSIKNADELELVFDVQNAIAGDYNEDLKVDGDDYILWQTFFGQSNFDNYIDGNLNGVIDAADYTIWRDNLGKQLPGAGGSQVAEGLVGLQSAGVPEPASWLLAIGIGGSLCGWRFRRRSVLAAN
jgi:hypothetical protein